jgi:hypothetical protein
MSRSRKLLFSLIVVFGLVLFLELTTRAYWWAAHDVSAGRIPQAFYPELGAPEEAPEDGLDILLLGGSVLEYAGPTLEKALQAWGPGVRVHNAAREAHSSLDSLYKYEQLAGRHFDAVVFYHAINEVRANNIAPDDYREDYSHYSWYANLRALRRHPERSVLSFPYTLDYLLQSMKHRLGWTANLPTAGPPAELLNYGGDIKTERAFRENLSQLLALAADRQEPVLLMSFAWFVPDDYSAARFGRRLLDYDPNELGLPIEIWGKPEHVVAGVQAHNRVIHELVPRYPDAVFLDQADLMPHEGRFFSDICHFTQLGQARFVENMLPALRAMTESAASP